MIRLGLCCIFKQQPIKFRRTTAKHLKTLTPVDQKNKLADICLSNAKSLIKALKFCHQHGIGDFRINSQILPLKTHPEVGYDIEAIPGYADIIDMFRQCGSFARQKDIRTTFHPDQFIILSSPDKNVVERSLADLVYQAQVANWVNADVINIHGGGVYGDKNKALKRLAVQIEKLPDEIRHRLTLENDDRSYTPQDLLPVCHMLEIPLVYDVHHHRCNKDQLNENQATDQAMTTWNREPLFHVSSPISGWEGNDVRSHHDYIDVADIPECWMDLNITVEVEAKAKELAVLKLKQELEAHLKNSPET